MFIVKKKGSYYLVEKCRMLNVVFHGLEKLLPIKEISKMKTIKFIKQSAKTHIGYYERLLLSLK